MAKIKLTAIQKKVFIGLVVIVLLASAGVALWMRYSSFDDTKTEEDVPLELSINSTGSQAASFVADGETEKAMAHYDEQIKLAGNDRERKSLLVKKSIIALDVGQYDVAIASAKQADEIESDTQTMRALADAYAANGNKEEALVYYRKLLALEKPTSTQEGGVSGMQLGPSIENIIKELEQ